MTIDRIENGLMGSYNRFAQRLFWVRDFTYLSEVVDDRSYGSLAGFLSCGMASHSITYDE